MGNTACCLEARNGTDGEIRGGSKGGDFVVVSSNEHYNPLFDKSIVRLGLYSNRTPDKKDFVEALAAWVVPQEYAFESVDATLVKEMLKSLVQKHTGSCFVSVQSISY